MAEYHIHPNLFAYFALLIWPVVALFLYSRLSVARATIWTILAAYLLLPVRTEIKIAMIPVFDKQSIPNLAALGCCFFIARRPLKLFSGFGLAEVLILILIVSPFITSLLNPDPIVAGGLVVPGVGPYDAGSAVIFQFIFMLPFFLGRQFLRSTEDNVEILRAIVVAGLAYSVLMLFEVRMSPQLHNWVYGYFPSSFSQQIREGGFRPAVFLGHGLVAAFFAMMTVVAAATLWRLRIRIGRLPPAGVTGYLSIILIFCRTMSALLYAMLLVPLVRWASPRWQMRVAGVLVVIALTYPMLRTADLIPTSYILNAAYSVNVDRADSLKTRFVQERELLDKAWQRIWFGWGRYGRNRVYSDNPYINRSVSIVDGYWIETLGTFGLVGFVAMFGLLSFAVLRAAAALKLAQTFQDKTLLAALALISAINMIDLLPNSSISPWSWLLAGSLLGRAEALHAMTRQVVPIKQLKTVDPGGLIAKSR